MLQVKFKSTDDSDPPGNQTFTCPVMTWPNFFNSRSSKSTSWEPQHKGSLCNQVFYMNANKNDFWILWPYNLSHWETDESNNNVLKSYNFSLSCLFLCWLPFWGASLLGGFPCGSAGKESICNTGDLGSIPGLGRSPGEGKVYPLQYSVLENSMDCIVHGVANSWTWLSNCHSLCWFQVLER